MPFTWLARFREWRRARERRPACSVTCDEQGVVCRHNPTQRTWTIAWDDLQRVVIETNDEGPWRDDVFFVLEGSNSVCVVPNGAEGDAQLVERLQALPGFDNQALIAAMGSTDNATFLCWRRSVD